MGKMLNYVTQLNMFENLCFGILPPKAQIIYYKLFKWSNRFGLGNPFQLSNSVLMIEAGIADKKTFIANRNLLKQKGFIEFEQGKKGSPSTYCLVDLSKCGCVWQPYFTPNNTPNVPPNPPPNVPPNMPPQNESLQSNNIKKEKQNKPKQDGVVGLFASEFEDFWDEYPRRVNKEKARTIFVNLLRTKAVDFDTLIIALKKQKKSIQWTKDGGQFIPHPTTWLNQHRWMDELDVPDGGAATFEEVFTEAF